MGPFFHSKEGFKLGEEGKGLEYLREGNTGYGFGF